MASALSPEVPFYTVEIDEQRAAAAASLFTRHPNVCAGGDWSLILARGPFQLLFIDD
jgi:predicted O-methyltransferase YrrM